MAAPVKRRVTPDHPQGSRAADEPVLHVSTRAAAAVFFGLALLWMLPALLPGNHMHGVDYLRGGYIFIDFTAQRFDAGHLPKWVPNVFGGLPLFANPGSTYYPVHVIGGLFLSAAWLMPLTFIVQFGVGGLGMFMLARELGTRSWVALFAGLAFEFTGILTSAIYAGHDGRVIVATLAPMLLFFIHRLVRSGTAASAIGLAATAGFALLSFQIQTNYYLLLAGAAWAAYCVVHSSLWRTPRALAARVAMGLAAVAFAFAMSAVNFLPFRDYVADSPRGAERGYEFATSWSLPPVELAGLAVPEHTGTLASYGGGNPFKLNTEYVGALVLGLLALGMLLARRDTRWWFFAGLSLATITIALGGHTPIYRVYYALLPGTQQFRAPSVSLFLLSLSLVIMAALTLEHLARRRESARSGDAEGADTVTNVLAAFAACSVVALLLAAAGVIGGGGDAAGGVSGAGGVATGFGRFALFALASCALLWAWWRSWMSTNAFIVAALLVMMLDLTIVGRRFFETVPDLKSYFAPDDVARFLQQQPPGDRVWVSPFPPEAQYRGDTNYLMLFGLELAGGEHGNQLQRWNEYAGTSGAEYVDWSNFTSSWNFLHAANIRYMITTRDLTVEDGHFLREVHRGSAFVYENTRALPRTYLAARVVATPDSMAALDSLRNESFDVRRSVVVYGTDPLAGAGGSAALGALPLEGTARMVSHTPDRVQVHAVSSRPAVLVLADNYHRDWRASVNGEAVPVVRANHTFRGVAVGAGESDVVFEFEPASVRLGFIIYVACMIVLALSGAVVIALRMTRRVEAV